MNGNPVYLTPGTRVGCFRVAHALPHRVRLKAKLLCAPGFDMVYFQALLEAMPGVRSARGNARGGSLVIVYDGREETWRSLEERLSNIPQETRLLVDNNEPPVTASDVASKAFLTLLAQPLPHLAKAGVSWAVSLGTILKGMETLLSRGVKVEVLDALAIGLSLVRRNYFTAGAITTLLALGEYLEEHSEQRSTELLKSLLRPQAEQVWVLRDGAEVCVPVSEVMAGEHAVCGTGDMIPVDGVVVEGEASVNQSSISGESVPIHIQPGDNVISGSVMEEGRLVIAVERAGSETSMARISRFIDQSLRAKSKRQTKSAELADKLVPVTLGMGAVAAIVTRDLSRAASILTVDFSCAIKLASPIAVRSGMYAAGQEGVLLKGAEALDALLDVDTLVFDKTGTLTTGRLSVTDILPLQELSGDELLCLAAGAEEHYDHPVARAVVREAKNRKLTLPPASRVDFIVAHGVSAFIDGSNVLVGSHHFIAEDEGVPCTELETRAHVLRHEGKSLLYVAREGTLAGIIALRDAPRPEAAEVLETLKKQGIKKIIVLTGDHRETARALQEQLPQIDAIHHELKPEDKAAIVAKLKESGHCLAYVGDGVNDAPALVSAHVGICMPGGADLAKEAAQVVLLHEDLRTLVVARQAAERTNRIIRTCFASTIGLNSLAMLMAAGGLPPVGAAILHNASTVGILGYAAMAGGTSLRAMPRKNQKPQETAC